MINETKTDNELIAEFMGWKKVGEYPAGKGEWASPDGKDIWQGRLFNAYQTSWDWLMPVVEKIESILLQVRIDTAFTNICGEFEGIKYNQDTCFEDQLESKINVTYRAVVEFIKWYNENKQS